MASTQIARKPARRPPPPPRLAPVPVRRGAARLASGLRRVRHTLTDGDRPYLLVMVAVLAVTGLMLSGPVGRFLDGRERVELLEHKQAVLEDEVERLQARAADLRDREHIELVARERLGLVKPGEIPYVVVTPEAARPQVEPAGDVRPGDDRPWYRRLWDAIVGG